MERRRELSLPKEQRCGIYVHVPFCRSKCRYCDFTSYPEKIGLAEAYMACVYKEMKLRAEELHGRKFASVYFGGGTPSVIDAKWIAGAVRRLRELYAVTPDAEITVELNPESVTAEKLAVYTAAGINRFSVGMQAASDVLLQELGRAHTVSGFRRAAALLRGKNFNADIIIGLKGQTAADVKEAVSLAAESGARHVSMYALTPEDGTPMYGDYLNGDLPDEDEVAALYNCGRAALAERGFYRYEVSNFAKAGFASRHNRNYWQRGEYIGFGVAASSFIAERRFTNTRDLDDYIKCILTDHYPVVDDERTTPQDAKFERVMLALRTEEGLSLKAYAAEFGADLLQDFSAPLQKNAPFLEQTEDGCIRIKEEYLFVQNHILVDFLQNA